MSVTLSECSARRHITRLQTLPTDCILEICRHLDLNSLLSLRVTARSLHNTITVFEHALASKLIQRDILTPTLALRVLSKSSTHQHLARVPTLPAYAALQRRQQIATDILHVLLKEMGVLHPHSMEVCLERIYRLWEVLDMWRSEWTGSGDLAEYEESVAVQTRILRYLNNSDLDMLVATVGALTGALCGFCAKARQRGARTSVAFDGTTWRMTVVGMSLEERVSYIISEGLEAVHQVLFGGEKEREELMEGLGARRAVKGERLKWFLFVAALEVLEERGQISRRDKALKFGAVTDYIGRRSVEF